MSLFPVWAFSLGCIQGAEGWIFFLREKKKDERKN